jgi:hypothetical protein
VNVTKQFIFDKLEKFCCKLVVAEEIHYNGLKHHHIFIRTLSPVKIDDLKRYINSIYGLQQNESGHSLKLLVEKCKSEKTWVKYITKQDCNPLFKGVDPNSLSFYYQAIQWARNTVEFDYSDPFILNHPQYFRLLEYLHTRVRSKIFASQSQCLRPIYMVLRDDEIENNWHLSVLQWWNEWSINGWIHKKKQLYLYGPSNTGKTTFIHKMLGLCINPANTSNEYFYENQCFQPLPNEPKYAYQDYDSSIHKILKIDEFEVSEYKVSDLKKLLAGESFRANGKNQSGRVICHRNPVILISNFEPPSDQHSIQFRGLRERLFIVYADRLIQDFI